MTNCWAIRKSAHHGAVGRRITTSCSEAASVAETCTTRGSRARAKASISRSVSIFTGKAASFIGSASV